MKVSIITVVYNGAATIEDCIESISGQTYPDMEHIIIDGGSTDGTQEIIKKYERHIAGWISGPDNGIYDAMNKGIAMATGYIIGILNSDDIYADNHVIADVIKAFAENKTEACYSDLMYVDRNNTDRVVRYWKSGDFYKERFRRGWMPPHPTFFVKKNVYERYGLFNLAFPLAADYELMLRFLYKYEVSTAYIPRVLVKMRAGGTSNPGLYTIKAVMENYRAWTVNGLTPNLMTFFMKPFSKIRQYFQ